MTAADPLARLGPKTQAWLAELGVHSHAQLVELGAVEAFVQLKARGHTVARTLLWALLRVGLPWQRTRRRAARVSMASGARAAYTAAAAGLGRGRTLDGVGAGAGARGG